MSATQSPFDETPSWKELDELFHAALELPQTERREFLESAASGNEALAAQVLRLLERDAAPGQVTANLGDRPPRVSALAGESIGPWRLTHPLGVGGMGEVWGASRTDEAFDREVAVKVLREGFASQSFLRRFRRERRLLASLEHPDIAQLIDAGSLPDGRPALVLEYVDGAPLDAWCDQRRLKTHERVVLLARVARAVAAAHGALVVHRDLKPANILITADGAPKLLDFGVATSLEDAVDDELTAVQGRAPLTAAYASPEQLRGDPVGVRSDVYSLGVILYELLVGTPGHDGRTAGELLRTRQAGAPPLASRRALEASPEVLEARGCSDARSLARALRGDLDSILAAALAPDPDHRCPSAEALADDLERHLARLPVRARRQTMLYRGALFLRRHTLTSALGAGLVLALSAGFAGTLWQARLARSERDRALRLSEARQVEAIRAAEARRRTEDVRDYLCELLAEADPSKTGTAETTVREVLDGAATSLTLRFATDPITEAALRETIARVRLGLGQLDPALEQVSRALELATEAGEEGREVAVESLGTLAEVLFARGEVNAAHEKLTEALALLGPPDERGATLEARLRNDMGVVLRNLGDPEAARAELTSALELYREQVGDTRVEQARVLGNLAGLHRGTGDLEAALAEYRAVLAMRDEVLEPDHPERVQTLSNLAVVLMGLGRFGDAVPHLEEALTRQERVLGPNHPDVAIDLSNLGTALMLLDRSGDAVEHLTRCVMIRRAQLPESSEARARAEVLVGEALVRNGNPAEALPHLEIGVAAMERLRPADHPQVVAARAWFEEAKRLVDGPN